MYRTGWGDNKVQIAKEQSTNGEPGNTKGSWFRVTEFVGAKGPYCQRFNDLSKEFYANFDNSGRIKTKPDLCNNYIEPADMNGLKYDVADYAYRYNAANNAYDFVGKDMKQVTVSGS